MKWYEYLKSTKPVTGGEDLADTVALIIICALLVVIVTM